MRKQGVALLIGFVIGFWIAGFISGRCPLQAFESKTPLDSQVQPFQSPKEIARFMWRHFRFEPDQRQFGEEDYWQSPEELLASRSGDCEDFALFAHAMLKRMGQSSFILNIYGNRFAHSVTAFKQKGSYFFFDEATLVQSKAQNLSGLVSEIYPFWKKAAIILPVAGSRVRAVLKEIEK